MAKVKNASGRAGGKAVSCAWKTVAPAKAGTKNKSALVHVSRNDSVTKKARVRRVRNGDIAKVARKFAARAVERIAEIMESDSNREALAAAFHLLDRAYLLLPDALKDEGRLAYALSFVVNGEGGLHPEWIAVWSTINHVLRTKEFPPVAEVRALKLRK